jgi:FdrA protein
MTVLLNLYQERLAPTQKSQENSKGRAMAAINAEIRRGAYYDSVMLMQLQRALADLPGVLDAGVVMGTDANKDILAQSDLLTPAVGSAGVEDLIIVVRAESEEAATAALGQVDDLLTRRKSTIDQEYLPKSLESAGRMLSGDS